MANFMKNNQSNLAYFPSPYTANWRLLGELSLSVGKKWLYTLGIFSLALCEFDLGLQTLGIRFFGFKRYILLKNGLSRGIERDIVTFGQNHALEPPSTPLKYLQICVLGAKQLHYLRN